MVEYIEHSCWRLDYGAEVFRMWRFVKFRGIFLRDTNDRVMHTD